MAQGIGDLPPLRAKILLLPGTVSPETALGIQSGWVMSYGLSGKDSITVSSLESDFAVLALQRELVTLDGAVIERQEIPLHLPAGDDSQALRAVYGGLLALGVPPKGLAEVPGMR